VSAKSHDSALSPYAALCRPLSGFVAPKGQEKGNTPTEQIPSGGPSTAPQLASGSGPVVAYRMDWRTRIVANPDVLVGKPVIKGTRISVELVIDLLAAGYTPQQIVEQYDHLTAEDIRACLAYAKEVIQAERVYAVKR